MQKLVQVASVHQANTLLSVNVFAHLQTQAMLLSPGDNRPLVWHVIDHDDCRDRRFRQARLPALNGSQQPQTISLTLPSGLTMGAVQLTAEMRGLMIDQLRGYVEGNSARLSDLGAWFGQSLTLGSLRESVSVLCDLISTSVAGSVVDLNIEFAAFFARSWLKRDVKPVSSTAFYAAFQSQTAEMLAKLQDKMGDGTRHTGNFRLPRWDWWSVRPDGSRVRKGNEPAEWREGEIDGHSLIFRRGTDPLSELAEGEIIVPSVLADTVADAILRQIDVATQYWRSEATLALASSISERFWGKKTRSCMVGQPGVFALPAEEPPHWLAGKELEAFRSGLYSAALYWILGMEGCAPPLDKRIKVSPEK